LSLVAGSPDGTLGAALDDALTRFETEMVDFRRDLHANPELSWAEERTTGVIASGSPTPASRPDRSSAPAGRGHRAGDRARRRPPG
jgi:hypothetical protein